jgi:phosphoenolpyruvate carboxykinase (ATP)
MSRLRDWGQVLISERGEFDHPGVQYQCTRELLVTQTLLRGEGSESDTGALCINTGKFTGRSPKDKFIVQDAITRDTVNWNQFNQPISEQVFEGLRDKMLNYLDQQPAVWVRDVRAGDHPEFHLSIRIMNENPWSNLFVANMFLPPDYSVEDAQPDWLIIQLPSFQADPTIDGVPHAQFSLLSFTSKTILIGGTGYTGEMKKGIFTVLNFLLPHQHQVLSMHCSANKGTTGEVAIFFGLSGTGKTTLSADPNRQLIGDDEHGWTDEGVFNFEGGCYAKVINLNAAQEPEIFSAIRKGALLENTRFIPDTHQVDFANKSVTENTRVSYPLSFIPHACSPARGGHPAILFFLTCDAYGVLPPISQLSVAEAMYQFISGYTAKVAGTETGISEPVATFSACFGAPFMPLHPGIYAQLLGKKLQQLGVEVWLINTGWIGGAYGTGSRIKLSYTRTMIEAVFQRKFQGVTKIAHPNFGMQIPTHCEGIPDDILIPWKSWQDENAYQNQSNRLATMFAENFEQYASGVDENIRNAGPKVIP